MARDLQRVDKVTGTGLFRSLLLYYRCRFGIMVVHASVSIMYLLYAVCGLFPSTGMGDCSLIAFSVPISVLGI